MTSPEQVWDEFIDESFRLFDPDTPYESDWYGPYNMLLTTLFPKNERFQVVPQYIHHPANKTIVTSPYLIQRDKNPIFFLEVKPRQHLVNDSMRAAADAQMRERFIDLRRTLKLPMLYGISAMGTAFSVYEYDAVTRLVTPSPPPPNPAYLSDLVPEERWNHDIMELDGANILRDIVKKTKLMI